MASIVCPLCDKDDATQKVSAVLLSGEASGSFSGPSSSHVNVGGKSGSAYGYTHLSGSSMTELAKLLVPPTEPIKPEKEKRWSILASGCLTYLAIGIISLSAIGIVDATIGTDYVPFEANPLRALLLNILNIIGLVTFLLLCIFLYKRFYKHFDAQEEKRLAARQAGFEIEKPKWDNAIQRWNSLYCCQRDGVVFDPENKETCVPTSLDVFLYTSAS